MYSITNIIISWQLIFQRCIYIYNLFVLYILFQFSNLYKDECNIYKNGVRTIKNNKVIIH